MTSATAVTSGDEEGAPPTDWVRNLVTIVALLGWFATIIGYLIQGKFPDAALLGVPGAIWLAMSPSLPSLPRRRPRGDR